MLVVDSSAIVAILTAEPGSDRLAERIQVEPIGRRFISTANFVEAGTVLAGRRGARDAVAAIAHLEDQLGILDIELAPVDEHQARLAVAARIEFGKGFRTAAKLNFGDSFAYALAKSLNAPLLYVGNDFAATDIESALA